MNRVGQIGESALDDVVDELTTGLVYKYSNEYFKPLEDSIKSEEDSILGEALESGFNTLKFMTMNAVIVVVGEYAVTRMVTTSTIIFSYIKGSSVAGRAKNKVRNVLSKFGRYGGAVGKFVQGALGVVVGTQEERLALAKMANDNVNNITSLVGQERQNQIMMRDSKVKHFDRVLSNSQQAKQVTAEDKNTMFLHKMKTGTWKNTKFDKQLYQRCTGFNFAQAGQPFNKTFVDKLNSFKEYAVNAEGKVINLSQTHLDYITATGLTKLKG